MTENPVGLEIGTQTALPTTSLNFSLLRPSNGTAKSLDESFATQMRRNEIALHKQMRSLQRLDAELNGTKAPMSVDVDEQYDSIESAGLNGYSVISLSKCVCRINLS